MRTLGSLVKDFEKTASANDGVAQQPNHAALGGQDKTASEGENMKPTSLQDIWMDMNGLDKEAAQGNAPESDDADAGGDGEEPDFAALAAQVAEQEAMGGDEGEGEFAAESGDGEGAPEKTAGEMMKIAAEYDAAGRIMARGFMDELQKIAAGSDTSVSPNRNTESPSVAKTPALGNRGLPTTPTNFAGSPNHDQRLVTNGGRDQNKNVLATKKKIKAGVTGDNAPAAAETIGSGAPVGFATVRDLAGGKPA